MGLVVPSQYTVATLTGILTPNLTLKLYSNNVTPASTDTASSYTEVTGGGYASKPLVLAHWTIVEGPPSVATYDASQTFTFTSVTSAPGVMYGYYVTRDSDGKLMWAQRFGSGVVPFAAVSGSIIKILPKYAVQSQF